MDQQLFRGGLFPWTYEITVLLPLLRGWTLGKHLVLNVDRKQAGAHTPQDAPCTTVSSERTFFRKQRKENGK